MLDDWCRVQVFPHKSGSLFMPPDPAAVREARVLDIGPGHWSDTHGHLPCGVQAGDRVLLAPFTLVAEDSQCLTVEENGAGEWIVRAWDLWAIVEDPVLLEVVR